VSKPSIPLTQREWLISPQMYSELLELKARYGEFGNDSRFIAEVISRFELRPFTEYRIVVDRTAWKP
jgi:hypothetical protein